MLSICRDEFESPWREDMSLNMSLTKKCVIEKSEIKNEVFVYDKRINFPSLFFYDATF